jgi:phosphoglycolate phosphatase
VPQPIFLFDLDGTLVDSSSEIISAVNSARAEMGFPFSDAPFLKERIGLPADRLFEELDLNTAHMKELVTIFRNFLVLSIEKGSKLFPGVIEFLAAAKERGYSLSIVTNKPTELARRLVASSALVDFIDLTVGVGEFPPKPEPNMLSYCMTYWGANNAIMFGDRVEDMKAAVMSGAEGIGVAQSIHSEIELFHSGASQVFPDFTLIHEYFKANRWGQ